MAKRKEKMRHVAASLWAAAALCVFSSCASAPTDSGNANIDAPSDAALLDDAKVGATDVSDNGAFADLEAKKDDSAAAAAATSDASAAITPTDAAPAGGEGDTYYKAVGGESLRRVAVALYGKKSAVKALLAKNSDLRAGVKLSTDQKVYFDMDGAHPQAKFLTKDLLDRYAAPFAEKVKAQGGEQTTVTVNKGESLQQVSRRLYGTSRYWPELFLANHDKISNYDKVPVGLTLTAFQHAQAAPVAQVQEAPKAEPTVLAELEDHPVDQRHHRAKEAKAPPAVSPTERTMPIQPEPMAAPVPTHVEAAAPPPMDPIPETPPAPAVKPHKKIVAVADPAIVEEVQSENSSFRRILYVSLVLLIGGLAFYFTRPRKRRSGSDILDINTEATAPRPKLPKDNQKHGIG